ncbi:hypothetical protein DHEL01_v208083 [Diaporthe helianthi]|uniref:Uncharacterized protein n=1 Tax=Diaporthe helianthi TaxID=158607 RepID=A0A2P5HTE1_DIAHE|nr:hypothetical protein DHEL01_v208083 [Diaporthe helianthi]
MCLTIEYYCICGVVARTEQILCSDSLALPPPTDFEETHQLRQLSVILPEEEWDARQGLCPQESCPQNNTSTAADSLYKCPGCSTICHEAAILHGHDGTYGVDDLLVDERLQWQIQNELSGMFSTDNADNSDKSGESKSDFERELTSMDFAAGVNQAEFLPRGLWQTYECPVDFCPFNRESMARASENLSSVIIEVVYAHVENPVQWTTEDDDRILDLASHNTDDQLIAAPW